MFPSSIRYAPSAQPVTVGWTIGEGAGGIGERLGAVCEVETADSGRELGRGRGLRVGALVKDVARRRGALRDTVMYAPLTSSSFKPGGTDGIEALAVRESSSSSSRGRRAETARRSTICTSPAIPCTTTILVRPTYRQKQGLCEWTRTAIAYPTHLHS